MDISQLREKGSSLIKKYKYVVIVLLIGIILMVIPTSAQKVESAPQAEQTQEMFTDPTEELQNILSQIKGAGKVRIMLTRESSEQTVYQLDKDETTNEGSTVIRVDTVILSDSSRNQKGMIEQTLAPRYRGAVVVCQGADNASVKLAIMDAVKNMTGLGYDRISVLKMK